VAVFLAEVGDVRAAGDPEYLDLAGRLDALHRNLHGLGEVRAVAANWTAH
jgi:hypothetical protein